MLRDFALIKFTIGTGTDTHTHIHTLLYE